MIRRLSTIALSVAACCLMLLAASFFSRGEAQQAQGNQPLLPAQANWRYQMIALEGRGMVLLDTQTGRAWVKFVQGRWEDLETPPSKEKK
jgi:hypothetical protein